MLLRRETRGLACLCISGGVFSKTGSCSEGSVSPQEGSTFVEQNHAETLHILFVGHSDFML